MYSSPNGVGCSGDEMRRGCGMGNMRNVQMLAQRSKEKTWKAYVYLGG